MKLFYLFVLFSLLPVHGKAPNILIILADDLGYSDIGCYGGEIATPNIDRIAENGARFNQFRVNPMCTVTRTSLLTGHEHYQSNNYKHSEPIATPLKQAGYKTFIAGKWHQPKHPLDWGFDRFYGHLIGAINSWTGSNNIYLDRKKVSELPEDWYATDAFTDFTIDQISEAKKEGAPFFSFVSYNAPHTPCHAPEENVLKYKNTFNEGWETLREKRLQRLKELGIIDERYVNSPARGEVRRWDELPKKDQEIEAKRMSAYAGMVDRMDENIGRILKHLQKIDELQNTVILFLSDNGGAYGNGHRKSYDKQIPWEKDSNPFLSNGWARLRCTPFVLCKQTSHEGGVVAPLIISWGEGLGVKKNSILNHRLHVTDLYPTLLEIAGAQYSPKGRQKPLYGNSFNSLIKGNQHEERDFAHDVFWCFDTKSRGYLSGDWKIAANYNSPWELFNIAKDPAESKNLATENPEKVEELFQKWLKHANTEANLPKHITKAPGDKVMGWGFHRLQIATPHLIDLNPLQGAMDTPVNTDLELHFSKEIDLKKTTGTIKLFKVSQPDQPVWTANVDESHPSHGTKVMTFSDLPELEKDTNYFLMSDQNWIKAGGKAARWINDGAFWWRFRTAP